MIAGGSIGDSERMGSCQDSTLVLDTDPVPRHTRLQAALICVTSLDGTDQSGTNGIPAVLPKVNGSSPNLCWMWAGQPAAPFQLGS